MSSVAELRLAGWRHTIAVLAGILCLVAAIPVALATPFAWFSDDIVLAIFDPDDVPGGPDRAAYYAREDLDVEPAVLADQIRQEAFSRMPLEDYAERPLWSRMRLGAAIAFLVAVIVLISTVGVFRAREAARRRLAWGCIALGLLFAAFAADVQSRFALFATDLVRDGFIARASLLEEIEYPPESRGVGDLGIPEADEMKTVGLVLFASLSLPWQILGLILALLRPTREVVSDRAEPGSETPGLT